MGNTDNNVERAIEWIFSHPDGGEPAPEAAPGQSSSFTDVKDGDSSYQLAAFISHMGSSSHSGHYVCHIKDDGSFTMTIKLPSASLRPKSWDTCTYIKDVDCMKSKTMICVNTNNFLLI